MADETFGNMLRQARKGLRKTQTDIRKELGVSTQLISQWETDAKLPPRTKLEALARAYGLRQADCLREYQRAGKLPSHDEVGPGYIEQVLTFYADLARESRDRRWIIHSLSTGGFLTTGQPEIAQKVCECAATGVEIVYFALPGTVPAASLLDQLKARLKSFITATGNEDAAAHLWQMYLPENTVRDPTDELLIALIKLMGIFQRQIAVIEKSRHNGDPDTIKLSGAALWDRLFPLFYDEVDNCWIDVILDQQKNVRWVGVDAAGSDLAFEYANCWTMLRSHYLDHRLHLCPLLVDQKLKSQRPKKPQRKKR